MANALVTATLGWVARREYDLGGLFPAAVQGPAAVLFCAGYVLGAVYPDGAWRRALTLGLSIPAAHVVALVTGATLPPAIESFPPNLLALVPAVLGTYLGVAMRRVFWPRRRDEVQR